MFSLKGFDPSCSFALRGSLKGPHNMQQHENQKGLGDTGSYTKDGKAHTRQVIIQ